MTNVKDMTLRDWFAGQALAGILASKYPGSTANVAMNAYAYAEAMMKERPEP
jgi:hypothetical protein